MTTADPKPTRDDDTRRAEPASGGSNARALRLMLDLMSASERRRMLLLVPFVVLNAVVQVVGIASIMPFLALVANPATIQTNPILRWAFQTFAFPSADAFLVTTGLAVLVVMTLSNALAAFTQYRMLRFSWDMNHRLSVRVLREYLYKPYAFFLDHNTSGLAKNILGEVKQAIGGYLNASLNLAGQGMSALLILVLLVIVNPLLAFIAFGFLGSCYALVFRLLRRRLTEAGQQRSRADKERFKAANEALGGAKEIKLLGKERPFVQRFVGPSRRYGLNMARQQVIGVLPRYVFETLAFGGLLLIVLYLLVRDQSVAAVLPTLGLYAFATYRLLPALQGIFSAFATMRFSASAVEILHEDLGLRAIRWPDRDAVEALPVRGTIELRGVTFTYANGSRPVFEDLDLVVPVRTSVALVGATGSGKTTAVDLLLALHEPQRGHLLVDGEPVTAENRTAWQKNLGYVPQEIFLADDSVAANIAFGVPPEQIDMEAVRRAARQANIHHFIERGLPHGYSTEIGERGTRLSGGQRQRLGIARALYHDPDVLVLDEATSALDNVTEESVFAAVNEIGRSKTVVMIAHRISTVRGCDTIYLLDGGRVIASGTYEELIETSAEFRALARVEEVAVTSA